MKKLLTLTFLLISLVVFSQPANDNCSGAQSVTPDGSCQTGTLVGANDDWAGEVGCATTGGPNNHLDVWYSFVATDEVFEITATDLTIGNDLEIVLVEPASLPCTGPFTVLYSTCGASPVTGSYNGLTIGNTYYYTVSSDGNATGTFETCVDNTTPPSVTSNQDCVDATPICDNSSFSGNSSGSGSVSDLNSGNDGCLSGENESSWYTFTVDAGGTLDMTISPVNGTDDYDFAIWGPNPNCPPTSSPIRCSYAAGGGDTGVADGSGDNSENAFGDQWVEDLNVLAGETYIMVIDNYSSTTSPFDLTWGGSATMDCSILPIELVGFFAYNEDGFNKLSWITMSEIENESFIIERSDNGKDWVVIGEIAGAGNSSQEITYDFRDKEYKATINYYRLTQVDYNGDFERSKIVSVDNRDPKEISRIVNFMGQTVDEDYQGLRIIIYNDGSTEKRVGK